MAITMRNVPKYIHIPTIVLTNLWEEDSIVLLMTNVNNTETITRKLKKKGIHTGMIIPLKKVPVVDNPEVDIRLNMSLKRYQEKTYNNTRATTSLPG